MTEIHADRPEPGYYRMRRERGGRYVPVAIWRDAGGELLCAVGQDRVATDPHAIWTYAAGNKVSKAEATHAFERGYWPDEPPPVGHNIPLAAGPFDELIAEVNAKSAQAADWIDSRPVIITQADANYARNAQAELQALGTRADAMFEAEKAPIRVQAKAVDDKYRFRVDIGALADRLRRLYGKFLAAEEARLNAEQAARLKAEAEARAKKLQDDPVGALTDPQLPLEPAAPIKVQAGGGVGKRAGLRSVWVPATIDYKIAVMHFIDHPDLRREIDRLVKHVVKDSKGSAKIPGVTVKEDRQA